MTEYFSNDEMAEAFVRMLKEMEVPKRKLVKRMYGGKEITLIKEECAGQSLLYPADDVDLVALSEEIENEKEE